jgi:methyl-accepting chemotaxis protein
MVRQTAARPRSSSLVLTLVSIALGASLPGVFVVTLWGDAGPGARLAGVGLTLALSGAALALALRTLVTRRLQRLGGALARLTEGDFTRPLGARGGDEIASVMRAFDDLADRLRSRSAPLPPASRARAGRDIPHEAGRVRRRLQRGRRPDARLRERERRPGVQRRQLLRRLR